MNLINLRDCHLVTRAVLHTNTCDNIPEPGQKCLLDRPDSLPTVQSQKGVESGNETSSNLLLTITNNYFQHSLHLLHNYKLPTYITTQKKVQEYIRIF